jgi:hypothetical protein
MNLWKQIARRNAARAAHRRSHRTRPGLEAMESRALLNGGRASFKLVKGDLYERRGRHQSLVASDVVYFQFANKHTIIFGEANGNVYKKTISGAPQLIQAGPSTPTPDPQLGVPPTPTPDPQPGVLPQGTFEYHFETIAEMELLNRLDLTFKDGADEIQYGLRTVENPFSTDPANPTVVQTDYWDWLGHWEAQGSELIFDGQGMHTRVNTGNPSLNEQDPIVAHFVFTLGRSDQTHLYVILSDDFGPIMSPNGLTQEIILDKVS